MPLNQRKTLSSDWMTKLEGQQSLVSPSHSQGHTQPQVVSVSQWHIPAPSHSHYNHSPRGAQNVNRTLATEAVCHTDDSPHITHHQQCNSRSSLTKLPQDAVLRQFPNVCFYDKQSR